MQTFGRDLRAAIPGVRVVQPRDGATQERRYTGIDLSTAHNGTERVPPRAGLDMARGGTRAKPLRAQPEHEAESQRDGWVAAQVTIDPQPVGAIAAALDADVWETEHALKRLAVQGHVQRHNSRPGSPVAWTLPSNGRAAS